MVGKLSDKLEWMKNLSLFTLFRPKEIAEGSYNIWPVSIGLTTVALCIFIVAIVVFRKRIYRYRVESPLRKWAFLFVNLN